MTQTIFSCLALSPAISLLKWSSHTKKVSSNSQKDHAILCFQICDVVGLLIVNAEGWIIKCQASAEGRNVNRQHNDIYISLQLGICFQLNIWKLLFYLTKPGITVLPPTLTKHKADKKGNQLTGHVQKRHKDTGPHKKTDTISRVMNNKWQHLTEYFRKTACLKCIRWCLCT